MYVKRMFLEDEETTSLEIVCPSWEEIEAALRQMNGRNKNILILYPDIDEIEDGEFMSIGGGENQQFVCCVYDNDGVDHCLTNPEESSEEIIYVYMGQTTGQSKNQVTSIERVLLAVETYVQHGQLDTNLYWES
jgi:Immunity protein Imm1